MTKEKKTNVDVLGDKWILAPGGQETIQNCKFRLWDLCTEMSGLGALFRVAGNGELDADELIGIGYILVQISERLKNISERLASATVIEKEVADEKK
ncbi:MAG TPA: hypothetical protein VN132_15985 [Bdellovibrio sp.]|nr:hypothetical protein [Bdellovibrio sp.]